MRRDRSSFVVGRNGERDRFRRVLGRQPGDAEVAEVVALVEIDASLLVQLQQGQKAHDDVGQGEVGRQPAEGDCTEGREIIHRDWHALTPASPWRGVVAWCY